MIRLSGIVIAISVGLIAASLGAVSYLVFGLTGTESGMVALGAMTALTLYNQFAFRGRETGDLGHHIADLSRGVADLARQVAEQGRRISALESEEATARKSRGPNDPLASEIGELGALVKQLADTVAAHDSQISDAAALAAKPRIAGTEQATETIIATMAADPSTIAPPSGSQIHPSAPVSGPFKGMADEQVISLIRNAVEDNRIDLYLQPIVTLPQRKVRYYEALSRLRADDGALILPADFIPYAEKAGLMPRIDNLLLFRCVQVLRRLLMKNRDIGLFCNISGSTLGDSAQFRQFQEFLDANRALASSLTLEFTQGALRSSGPIENESIAALSGLGFRFSMDQVKDLHVGPRDLAARGVRFVKIPAMLLLNRSGSATDIHSADLSDLLGRHGISLIAERIETEAAVVDLLDYDVRFGQGFLFSQPRPVRAEAVQGLGDRTDPVAPPVAPGAPSEQTRISAAH